MDVQKELDTLRATVGVLNADIAVLQAEHAEERAKAKDYVDMVMTKEIEVARLQNKINVLAEYNIIP